MPSVICDCPYCLYEEARFEVSQFELVGHKRVKNRPVTTTHQSAGQCTACGSLAVLYFSIFGGPDPDNFLVKDLDALGWAFGKTGAAIMPDGTSVTLVGTAPSSAVGRSYRELPTEVQDALQDAEQAFLNKAFAPAVIAYRKTIETVVTQLVEEPLKKTSLAAKINSLHDSQRDRFLPEPIIALLNLVREEGNAAAHENRKVFNYARHASEVRELTHILLTYQYRLPSVLNDVQRRVEHRKQKGAPEG